MKSKIIASSLTQQGDYLSPLNRISGLPSAWDFVVSAVHIRGDRVRLPDVGQSREGRQVRHRDLPVDDLQKTKIVSARKTKTLLTYILYLSYSDST